LKFVSILLTLAPSYFEGHFAMSSVESTTIICSASVRIGQATFVFVFAQMSSASFCTSGEGMSLPARRDDLGLIFERVGSRPRTEDSNLLAVLLQHERPARLLVDRRFDDRPRFDEAVDLQLFVLEGVEPLVEELVHHLVVLGVTRGRVHEETTATYGDSGS
jgi:hypothetical protein